MPSGSDALGTVFRKQSGEPVAEDVAVANLQRAQQSAGDLLPKALRQQLERALGTDLSAVCIHTGVASARASDAIGPRAYAIGQDIHFAAGQFDPSSPGGRELIAHEVAHTVQPGGVAMTAAPT